MEVLKDELNFSSSLGEITSKNLEGFFLSDREIRYEPSHIIYPHPFTCTKRINLLLFSQYLLENNSVSSIYDPP